MREGSKGIAGGIIQTVAPPAVAFPSRGMAGGVNNAYEPLVNNPFVRRPQKRILGAG